MKEAIVILSLMGCDDSATSCTPIQTASTVFASQEACLRASEQIFEVHSAAQYPMVLARCDSKLPAQVAARPNDLSNDPEFAIHSAVPVNFVASDFENRGWFRVSLSRSVSAISAPISGLSTRGTNASQWVWTKTQSALDAINPF